MVANTGDGLLEELFKKEFPMEELKEAIKNISNNKQPEHDEIFPEFFKKPWTKGYGCTALNI
jgi:hypothetical protein